MIVRKLRPDDAPAITELLNEIIAIGGTTAYLEPKMPDYFEPFLSDTDKRVFLHVAEADGQIVGFQYIRPPEPGQRDIGGIATFARVGVKQRGIGTALFEATKAASIAAGYSALTAVIRADNTGGLAYYTKMGFTDHDIRRDVPLSDGTPVDRVEKRLSL